MKNRAQFSRICLLSAGILAVAPVKCNSIFEKSIPVADDGYEYVTVTGHLVPQRVKKGTQPVSDSNVNAMSGESLRDGVQKYAPSPKVN
jgi:hypothetical protein